MSDTSSVHNIVILGASYAGIGVAHGLLKGIPALETATKKRYKVTLMANSTRFWYSAGAPRAMLIPYPNSIDDSFPPIKPGLEKYPAERWEFFHAEITGLNTSTREVLYKLKDDGENLAANTSTIHFDTVVIATGSTGESPLYAIQGSHVPTYNAYKDVQARLPTAKSVMVVGGGSAGTETAGELGHLHGKNSSSPKDITILSGSSQLLTQLRPDVGKRAEEMLTGMGVKTLHNVRFQGSKKLPGGGEEVKLSDGSKRTVDILLVATGRRPASSWVPKSLLNDQGRVITDEYLRIPNVDSAYATGDIASVSPMGLIAMQTLVPSTIANVIAELRGKGKGKTWKMMTDKEMQIVPVGPNGGVGVLFGWWLPSIAVKMIKSKDFMFSKALGTVMG